SESGASWIAATGTDFGVVAGTIFRLRFVVQVTNAKVASNRQFKAQYNKLSAGWVDITTISSNVRAVGSANTSWTLTDEDATTQLIGGGSFITGAWNDDNVIGENNQIDFGGSDETELELCLRIIDADVALGNTIQIRIIHSDDTLLDVYTSTPTITVGKTLTQTHILDATLKSEGSTTTHILQATVGTFRQHKIMANLTKVGGGGSVTLMRGRGWKLNRPPLDVPFGVNWQSPQADGLTYWWPFLDSQGAKRLYERIRGNHGDVSAGDPTWNSDPVRGATFRFDGVVDAFQPSRLMNFGIFDVTISLWAKINSFVDNGGVFHDRQPASPFHGIFIRTETGGVITGNLRTTSITANTSHSPTAGEWYHFVLVADRHGSLQWYANGILIDSVDISGSPTESTSNTIPPYIGADEGGDTIFDGWMSDIRVYRGIALNASRIQQIYAPETRWDLYRPLRPRFVLSPVAAVVVEIASKTHVLDATLKKEGNQLAHILEAVKKSEGNQLLHVLDSILKSEANQLAHVIYANLKAEGTGVTHILDVILKKEGNQATHILDIVKKSEANQLAQILDATLLKTQTSAHILDVILRAEGTTTNHVLAAIKKSESNQADYTLAAILKSEATQLAHILQAELTGAAAVSHILDVILKKESNQLSHILDVIKKSEANQSVYILQTILLKTTTLNYILDATLKSEGLQVNHILDTTLKSEGVLTTHVLDVVIKSESNQASHILDIVLKSESNQLAHILQAELAGTPAVSFILDAVLKKESTQVSHTLDVTLRAENNQVNHVLDVVLKTQSNQLTHVLQAQLSKTTTAIYVLDVVLKREKAQTTFTLAAILKSESNTTLHILDAILKKESVQATHVLGATLKKTQTSIYILNTTLKKEGSQSTYVLDAILVLAATITVSHILDAVLVVVSLVSPIGLEAELDKDVSLGAMLDKNISLLAELDKNDIDLEASI
ncbi:MAG: LamG domain-containing protein, partial [Candidatus Thorarchaeota archaeon]